MPYWQTTTFSEAAWLKSLKEVFHNTKSEKGICIYIHLPFCESLCTFCGCNKRITKNHAVETPYIEAVLKEWNLYLNIFDETPTISEIHLGGGSPSFFSPDNLKKLINGLLKNVKIAQKIEFSFEGNPNNTTADHLQTLYNLGFKRVSFGVQDYDPVVQKAIHRDQPFEIVESVTKLSKSIGYESISHDLIYGLPFQTIDSVVDTIEKTLSLKPDRISFYSYAHVPWLPGNGQRGFHDEDLPSATDKYHFYETGKKMLLENGYFDIGMDNFALENDPLYLAFKEKTLSRNFMGYTTTHEKLLLGLGVSSISDTGISYSQNVKNVDEYIKLLNENIFPILKGHILTAEDVQIGKKISEIMCQGATIWNVDNDFTVSELASIIAKLTLFEKDGLINFDNKYLNVTEAGKPFLRNICMAFDKRMIRDNKIGQIFSQTI
jgi:oxygen-independent coproporphyrinogen-3 oxidase